MQNNQLRHNDRGLEVEERKRKREKEVEKESEREREKINEGALGFCRRVHIIFHRLILENIFLSSDKIT